MAESILRVPPMIKTLICFWRSAAQPFSRCHKDRMAAKLNRSWEIQSGVKKEDSQ